MTLFQDTGGDPRASLADVLAFYGALGDAAHSNPLNFAMRKASASVALARVAQIDDAKCNAVYFAGLLHATGAIGNAAYRKGERLADRLARMESWDVPAQGARICAGIPALPAHTADIVRWQSECWDGTGYPDQLRWHGIPVEAQMLALAETFLRSADPEEALGTIGMQSGRAFGPASMRVFTAWFHMNGGEEEHVPLPVEALDARPESAAELLDAIATRVDEHNGMAGRWQRVARLADRTAEHLKVSTAERGALAIAARIFGAGEIVARFAEDSQFDPLSRLGIDDRARNAKAAADFAQGFAALRQAADIVRLRSEWFDGTGKPRGFRSDRIPAAAGILAAAVAYDALERQYRAQVRSVREAPAEKIDHAAGTQFSPQVIRALLDVARAPA